MKLKSQKTLKEKMKRLLLITIIINFASCSTGSFETEQDLWKYLKNPDHGYYHQKNINGYDFSLLYKPTDVWVKQELSGSLEKGRERTQQIKKLRDKYHKYLYFSLSISKNGQELLSVAPKNRQEFGAMVQQLSFGMQEKVHLFTSKKDTIALADYSYPRMYGMSKSTSMLFAYPRDKNDLKEAALYFTLEDLGIYSGEVKFKIATDKLKNEPALKL
ncbi:MAG: hypothetical protein GKR88_15815 [Flavobacteriaceae bacterium]|nr:MAG: hypothetical protein GKR88_15815 [Flavobacteriaceae bacterium]